MDVERELSKLAGMLNQFYADADQALAVADPETAKRLSEAVATVKANHGTFAEGVKQMQAEAGKQLAEARTINAESEQKLKRARQAIDAARAEQSKPPKPVKKRRPDPLLARRVSADLLKHFSGMQSDEAAAWSGRRDKPRSLRPWDV